MNLFGKTVLVTGSTGFIGRHLCRHLLDAGADVTGVARSKDAPRNYRPGYCAVSADLADPTVAAALISTYKPDLIFHLAGEVSGAQDPELLVPMFHQNLAASVYLLQALVHHKCAKLITVGSIEESAEDEMPASPYGMAKQAARLYSEFARIRYELPIIQTRLHLAYGPGQSEAKLIPHIIGAHLRGRPPVIRTPSSVCDFVYVDDVVDALISAAAHSGAQDGEILEIRSGQMYPLLAVANQVAVLLNSKIEAECFQVPDRKTLIVLDRLNGRKNPDWQWRPSVSLTQGLAKTIEWYKSQTQYKDE
jgi:UDP-glucose 4-epimerase